MRKSTDDDYCNTAISRGTGAGDDSAPTIPMMTTAMVTRYDCSGGDVFGTR